MKKLSVLMVIILSILMVTGCSTKTIDPNKTTRDLYELEEELYMIVTVYFEGEYPNISFIPPKGSELVGDNLNGEYGDDWAQFYLEPQLGKWKIKHDKDREDDMEVHYSSYIPQADMEIKDYKFSQSSFMATVNVNNNYVKEDFEWSMWATKINDDNEGLHRYQTIVAEGTGVSPKDTIEIDASLDKLEPGDYEFSLWIYVYDGVEENSTSVDIGEVFTKK